MTNAQIHPLAPEEIMALLDGELAPEQAREVSAHLESCSNCARLAADLRGVSQMLSTWSVPTIPEERVQSIRQAIDARPARKFSVRRIHFGWKLWVPLGAGAVALLLIVPSVQYHRVNSAPHVEAFLANRQTLATLAEPAAQDKLFDAPSPPKIPPSASARTRSAGFGSPQRDIAGGAMKEEANLTPASIPSFVPSGPMISRTVTLTILAPNPQKSRAVLDAILLRHQGYAAQLDESDADGAHSLSASLRIPATQLAAALSDLKTLGAVREEVQKGEDVSEQHADLEARLKNARETEDRLRDILQHRTGTLSDILEVEEEISRVRGEIEGMEAEQQALEHRVTYATIDLQLLDTATGETVSQAPSTRLRHAFATGWHDSVALAFGILLFFIEEGPSILVWLILLAIPGYFIWRRYRRIRARE